MPNYSKSVIYKIHSLDKDINEIYVGSTCNFRTRKYNHKTCCNNPNDKAYNFKLYKYIRDNGGWDKFMMTIIKEYPCSNKRQLHIEERRVMEELGAKLNGHIPSRTHKESYKIWRDNNKEYHKEYYNQNKEKIKEYIKEYREKKKLKLLKIKKKEELLEELKQIEEQLKLF